MGRSNRTMRAGPPDNDLVTRASKGDKQAWDTLVERYAPLIWSICRRHQLSSADADDIGQRVWLQLVTRLDEVRDPAALPGWLATTTQRECGSIRRTVRRSQTLGRTLAAEQIPGQQGEMAEQELLAAERHAALCEALTRLPPCCQRLIAALIEDPPVPYAQISARLSIPAGSIGPSRSRCLEKLRRDPAIAALINAEDAPGEGGPERRAACCPPLCRAGRLPGHGQERLAGLRCRQGRTGPYTGRERTSAGFTRPFRAVTLRSGRWRSYDGVGSHDSDTWPLRPGSAWISSRRACRTSGGASRCWS